MPENVRKLRLFVASPGDVQEERECLTRVIDQLNRGIGAEKGLLLELLRWETHAWPAAGSDTQEIINRQLGVPDVFLGIFWKRLGTPTPRADSGTVEEFELAFDSWRTGRVAEIMLYFKADPFYPRSEEDVVQISKVLRFRERLRSTGLLFHEFQGVVSFERSVRDHLTQVVRKFRSMPRDRPDLNGRWIGAGADFYAEDGSPLLGLGVEMVIDSSSDPVVATATISDPENSVQTDLVLTGSYYNDEYIQMMYRARDRTRRQLGVAVLQIDPTGNLLRIHYAGFSPSRSTFVAGKLALRRQA